MKSRTEQLGGDPKERQVTSSTNQFYRMSRDLQKSKKKKTNGISGKQGAVVTDAKKKKM